MLLNILNIFLIANIPVGVQAATRDTSLLKSITVLPGLDECLSNIPYNSTVFSGLDFTSYAGFLWAYQGEYINATYQEMLDQCLYTYIKSDTGYGVTTMSDVLELYEPEEEICIISGDDIPFHLANKRFIRPWLDNGAWASATDYTCPKSYFTAYSDKGLNNTDGTGLHYFGFEKIPKIFKMPQYLNI